MTVWWNDGFSKPSMLYPGFVQVMLWCRRELYLQTTPKGVVVVMMPSRNNMRQITHMIRVPSIEINYERTHHLGHNKQDHQKTVNKLREWIHCLALRTTSTSPLRILRCVFDSRASIHQPCQTYGIRLHMVSTKELPQKQQLLLVILSKNFENN